jgi:hypothetical protein
MRYLLYLYVSTKFTWSYHMLYWHVSTKLVS